MLSFIRWCQFIDWFKFETRPSYLRNYGMAYTKKNSTQNDDIKHSSVSVSGKITFQPSRFTRDCPDLDYVVPLSRFYSKCMSAIRSILKVVIFKYGEI